MTMTVDELAAALKQFSGTTGLLPPPQAPGGQFNLIGADPGVVSTVVDPLEGLEGTLQRMGHVQMTNLLNPVFLALTGQRASTGTEPETNCEGGRIAGLLKTCAQYWTLGRTQMMSQPIDISEAGSLINRASPLDYRFLNDPFANLPNVGVAVTPRQLFVNNMVLALVQLLNAIERDYRPLLYTGNPANSNPGGYQEYNGLERLVNTGYRDIATGVDCPSLDSYLYDFDGADMQTGDNPTLYVTVLVETYRAIMYLARQLQINDLTLAFVGTYGAFLKLTELWPCVYNTYRCTTAAPNGDALVSVDGAANTRMIDDMRNGRYLMIDGMRVPFIEDDSMPETSFGGGAFGSDIYLLPLRSSTIGQHLYLEYFNFNGPNGAGDIISMFGPRDEFRISADGRYLVHFLPANHWCKQIEVVSKKRLILRTPFLAARFQNTRYTMFAHQRSPFPGNPYWVNGGNYGLPGQTWPYTPLAS